MEAKKTTNKFSPEVRARAVRMVQEHRDEYASQWAAISSIAAKIGCTAETLRMGAKLEQQRSGHQAVGQPTIGSGDRGLALRRRCEVDQKLSDAIVEVMLACASNDRGEQQLFNSVPVEADRQRQQLNAVLRDLGATPTTPVTVLSDGADGPRFLGESASPGPARHVLDWIHLSMRVQALHKRREGGRAGTKRISSKASCSRRRLNGSVGGYGTAALKGLWT